MNCSTYSPSARPARNTQDPVFLHTLLPPTPQKKTKTGNMAQQPLLTPVLGYCPLWPSQALDNACGTQIYAGRQKPLDTLKKKS